MKPRLGAHRLLLAALLASCVRPAVAPLHPDIGLSVHVVGRGDARARQACVDSVAAVLRSHGFNPDSGTGARVDIDVALERDIVVMPFNGEQDPRVHATIPAPGDPQTLAELTAKVTVGGAPPKVLRSAGAAQSDACVIAAERLADALQEAVDAPSR